MNVECKHLTDESHYSKSLQGRKIYKDQCSRCFHQPKDTDGIYCCMKCFNSFCKEHIPEHISNFKDHCLYFHYVMKLKEEEVQQQEITKLAIGKEGGALLGDQYDSSYDIYCHECGQQKLQNANILEAQLKSFVNMDSPFKKQALVAWQVQYLPCQHTLTLQQNPQNKDLTKCADCDMSTNLWLCLTCGNTGCGRKGYDGSGGNNHGIQHGQKTKHPVVVKLGTITAQGQASLYCYSCNDDVKDDNLHAHLAVLGINVQEQKKTEKTMAEMQLDLNLNWTLNKLLESKDGKDQTLYGQTWTGMNNIGNSCYLNSVVQSLNGLEEFRKVYFDLGQKHVQECKRLPEDCFYCQVAKVAIGLNNGKYSQKFQRKRVINGKEEKWDMQKGVSPYDFKLLIAEGNNQFLSARQQDALEYLQIIFDRLNKQEPGYLKQQPSIAKLFDFKSTNKLVCTKCQGYKLITTQTNEWKFPIPPPSQEDVKAYYAEVENEVDPEMKKSKLSQDPEYNVIFDKCVESMLMGDSVAVNCPNCKSQQIFTSKNYFKTTPKYLLSVANRFVLDNWVPKKLNPIIMMNQKFSIDGFLLENSKDGGVLMEEGAKKSAKKYSQGNIEMITMMGYTRNAAIRALIENKDNPQAAVMWIMENMDRADLNDPIPQEKDQGNSGNDVDPAALGQIMEMGFEQFQAKIALIKHKSNVPAALEWLFNIGGDVTPFMDLLNPPEKKKSTQKQEQKQEKQYKNYELFAVIVHLGKSVHHGHYVAYVKKGGDWIMYNDEKVSRPAKAMIGKGYVYLWRGVE